MSFSGIGVIIGGLIGGVGLFLLGMRLMTDGLKMAAGKSLRSLLINSTSTAMRGIFTGALLTSLVQSSSAVTVATIGFVNAGLVNLGQAITLIYGCNIGTTMTGWLVSLVGFHLNIKVLAMPAIGLGMLLRIFRGDNKLGGLGDALAGFGVFFLGIEVLKQTFEGVGESVSLQTLADVGNLSPVLFVGVGFLLTVLMQSSSASIAVILTAVAGNVVGVSDAAAAVIGANVGTTSTAALAVIGATPNAKRLAGAHVVFNLLTGLVAMILLPYFLSLITHIDAFFGSSFSATRFLALFHTVFNVVGVLMLYPFSGRLVAYLEKRFRSVEEDEGRARFLDGNVARTPVLALNALSMELRRVGEVAKRMAGGAISSESGPSPHLYSDKAIIDSLVSEVAKFGKTIQRGNVPAELDHELPHALRVSGYYNDIAELSLEAAKLQIGMTPMESDLVAELNAFKHGVVKYLETADSDSDGYSVDGAKEQLQLLREDYRSLKSRFLKSASKGELSVGQMVRNLDLIARLRRIAEQAEKGARYLDSIHKVKSSLENGTADDEEDSSNSQS